MHRQVFRMLPKMTLTQCPECIRNKVSPADKIGPIFMMYTECAPVNLDTHCAQLGSANWFVHQKILLFYFYFGLHLFLKV